MKKVSIISGRGVPLKRSDVDTDQIIPAEWLKRVERTGFEKGLFSTWRDDRNFVLNDERYVGAWFWLLVQASALAHHANMLCWRFSKADSMPSLPLVSATSSATTAQKMVCCRSFCQSQSLIAFGLSLKMIQLLKSPLTCTGSLSKFQAQGLPRSSRWTQRLKRASLMVLTTSASRWLTQMRYPSLRLLAQLG